MSLARQPGLSDQPALTEVSQALAELVPELTSIVIGPRQLSDLECLAVNAFGPLSGFLTRHDYRSVVDDMRMSNGEVWPIPITLAIESAEVEAIRAQEMVSLKDETGRPVAVLDVEDIFEYDKLDEAQKVFRTTDAEHPGVASLLSQGEHLVGGRVRVIEDARPATFDAYRRTPAQVRLEISARGWKTVAGFQTRNPIHRAHEYLTKCALEIVDGLLIHPLVGKTKDDDISADVRMRAYESLIENYYPADRVLLSVFPAAMRYAGPREAVLHALCRKSYGCTHFIVGRDHAGVGNYYGTFDAQEIFSEFSAEELGITPLFFDHAFWCRACSQMATRKTCPHQQTEQVTLSGTEVRRLLSENQPLPPEFSRPEVAAVLSGSAGL
jgi:sulfate adenylyltransferase